MTLERRTAAVFLAHLLTGATAKPLRERRVERVAFQQAPAHRVDDLVVTASRDGGTDVLELNIAVRRAPKFVVSDEDTLKLFGDLLAGAFAQEAAGMERRLAICVGGLQKPAQQVAQLSAMAETQTSPQGFFQLIRTPRRFDQALVSRLDHLVKLVKANLVASGVEPPTEEAERVTWYLLRQLDIFMLRLEPPDDADWVELLNQLEPWAREQTISGATRVRDRLESLAAGYSPAAADINLTTLRRDAHDVLAVERRRQLAAWTELRRLHAAALRDVRLTVGVEAIGPTVHLPRPGLATKVRAELRPGEAVMVSGESGVGKSALVVGELNAAAAEDPAGTSVVCLNIRLLPSSMAELRDALGAPLEDLLAEMSAPIRVLVLDAADVTIEREDHMLAALLRAAHTADVVPWVVSATDGRAAVRSVIEQTVGAFREFTVKGLDDVELQEVAATFPQLRRLVTEPRAKELLRRPAIVDLFVRSGSSGLLLSEADAFEIVWTNLVRNAERTSRGLPHARDQVMLQLGIQQLRRTDALAAYALFDASAVAGLQRDGLLRATDRWAPLPTFAHEILRTYAIARALLSVEDLVEELLADDAPRWTLPAVRLAIEVRLSQPDESDAPLAGRFVQLQSAVDRMVAAGQGERWGDLPSEAVLTLPGAATILSDAWPALVDTGAIGLRRLLRVIQQRHGRTGVIDRLVAEPVVSLLLKHGWPSPLRKEVDGLFVAWLRGLLVARETAGDCLRVTLRELLVARVAAGDECLAQMAHERDARLAARTPEEVAADEARRRELRAISGFAIGGRRRRGPGREMPGELTDKILLEQLALLGADLGEEGAALLRRVASDDPDRLAPALEEPLAGYGIVSYSPALLAELVEAYYLDERGDDYGFSGGMGDDGIRPHHSSGPLVPLAAPYRGPFLALFRADLPRGVACLNRLLNHAARARAQILRRPRGGEYEEPDDRYQIELDITGERRAYVGDGQLWVWYRGTGVGPYPCMSALQALEFACDEYIKAGIPPAALVRLMLKGCNNLAMPALVVGMLVRHLEGAGTALDPFLSEPVVWHLEFDRMAHEHSGLAARTEGIKAADRRTWNFRHVATRMALSATGDRTDALRAIGRRLVMRAAELGGVEPESDSLTEELAAVRSWAGSLDVKKYKFTEVEQGTLVEQVVEDEVLARLAPMNADLARGNDAVQLVMRYPERFDRHAEPKVAHEDLIRDLAVARRLAENPPAGSPSGPYDAPAAVAAGALEAHFRDGRDVPLDDLAWAAAFLVGLLNALADASASQEDYSVFARSADRAAARALPLLRLPAARDLRRRLADDQVGDDAINRAIGWVVDNGANETRLFLVRGFDPVWVTPCDAIDRRCHHVYALAVVEDTARETIFGPWDSEHRSTRQRIEGRVAPWLEAAEDERVDVPHLTAAIRGASAAAASSACCRDEATSLLRATLAAHRKGMRASRQHRHLHSANDAIAAARAVLDFAASGDTSLLFNHLDNYADDPRLLSEFLRALVAAGEENNLRAAVARDSWPAVLDRVVDLVRSGVCPRNDRYDGEVALAAVIPTPSHDTGYLHREYEGEPVLWADPVTLAPHIERWLLVAAGHRDAVDALADLLDRLPAAQQAQLGLPWMEQLVMYDPTKIAKGSFLLPEWLERVRPHAISQPLRGSWHRMADALTVAGDGHVARLAD